MHWFAPLHLVYRDICIIKHSYYRAPTVHMYIHWARTPFCNGSLTFVWGNLARFEDAFKEIQPEFLIKLFLSAPRSRRFFPMNRWIMWANGASCHRRPSTKADGVTIFYSTYLCMQALFFFPHVSPYNVAVHIESRYNLGRNSYPILTV